jgi:hypothetical protein
MRQTRSRSVIELDVDGGVFDAILWSQREEIELEYKPDYRQ